MKKIREYDNMEVWASEEISNLIGFPQKITKYYWREKPIEDESSLNGPYATIEQIINAKGETN